MQSKWQQSGRAGFANHNEIGYCFASRISRCIPRPGTCSWTLKDQRHSFYRAELEHSRIKRAPLVTLETNVAHDRLVKCAQHFVLRSRYGTRSSAILYRAALHRTITAAAKTAREKSIASDPPRYHFSLDWEYCRKNQSQSLSSFSSELWKLRASMLESLCSKIFVVCSLG